MSVIIISSPGFSVKSSFASENTPSSRKTSTNPVATIFAWSGALRKRGEMDDLPELQAFADRLEKATLDTINDGVMTKDLALLYEGEAKAVNSKEFLAEIRKRLEK